MKAKESPENDMKIALQVGTTLRITNNGDVVVDNPELELVGEDDAVLMYRFDPRAGEHVFRLVDPFADRQHLKTHRRDD
jgi:hypothetical protein